MAIGTTAAILGSAVIGAGASAIGASKNSKAINSATQAQTDSNAQSLALQEQIYGENKQALSPFQQTGVAATGQINALLGLQPAQQQPIQQQQPQSLQSLYSAFYGEPAYNLGPFVSGANPNEGTDFNPYGRSNALGMFGINSNGIPQGGLNLFGTQQQPTVTQQPSANDAFANYRNSTGYQFRVNEGNRAINSGYAGAGTLQSGAAMKGIADFGQNIASQEFGNYLGALQGQQALGAGAAGAQAGVATNFANTVTGINQNNANALANAAVAKANNSNALVGSIGGLASGVLGRL